MRRLGRGLGVLACAVVIMLPGAATALSLLNFNVAVSSGSLSHLVAAGPLDGSGLEIGSIHSLFSPLNSGATLACVDCELTFVTGNRLSFASAGGIDTWVFDHAGSSLTIEGKIPSIGIAAIGHAPRRDLRRRCDRDPIRFHELYRGFGRPRGIR